MVRHLIEREIKKRLAIRIRRQNEPGISMRALAKEYRTSLRVVCDAMTRSVQSWHELLEDVAPHAPLAKITPGKRSVQHQSPITRETTKSYEPDEDPTLDFDPDLASLAD